SLSHARRLKNRIDTLVYTFYLGQLLEMVTKPEGRHLGIKQIYRTSTMNLKMISKLESREFQNLVKLTDLMKDEL
ncbi:8773_t:CDS:2, partial [Gigaspora margarita]